MIAQIESEVKIFGINFFIVSVTFTVAMIVLSIIAGDLLDFYPVSFEVVFPFFETVFSQVRLSGLNCLTTLAGLPAQTE